MNLQTKILLSKASNDLINYTSKVLLLGSCFAENIGNKLSYYKFQHTLNPFGILFHPLAIEHLINRAINKAYFSDEDVFQYNEQWHCFDTHSSLSATTKDELLKGLNKAIDLSYKQLSESSHIVITLGTAWVYRYIETDTIVANCHKVPQKKFIKELMSVDEVQQSLEAIISLVRSVNENVSFVFTVSPVRHLKDGFVENQRSKSHLISAVHQTLSSRVLSKGLNYFPSYELMMDELRDYRFYTEDMIHPNDIAINYVWERFQHVWIAEQAYKTMLRVDEIQKGINHRPFNPKSEQHQQFLETLERRKSSLLKEYPHISF